VNVTAAITVVPRFCGDYSLDFSNLELEWQTDMTTLDIDSAIRSRAYQYWKAEGELPGRDLDYWLKAEAEVKAVAAPAKKTKSATRKPATRAKAKA
jgi:hypothetical protein